MMTWHYEIREGNTHVRVFMNDGKYGKCGDLFFKNEEFIELKRKLEASECALISFLDETPGDDEDEGDWACQGC